MISKQYFNSLSFSEKRTVAINWWNSLNTFEKQVMSRWVGEDFQVAGLTGAGNQKVLEKVMNKKEEFKTN